MPAREPRNNPDKPVGKGYKGDTRSLDSSKPLAPFTPIHIPDLDQLKVVQEFEAGEGSSYDLAQVLHEKFNVTRGILSATDRRTLVVDLATGYPQNWITGDHHGEIPLDGSVTLYTVIEDATDPTLFRLVIIGTKKETVFVVIREETAFIMPIDMESRTTIQAIANLYGSSLDKERVGFDAVMQILPGLFYKLFYTAIEEPCKIDFKVWHTKGEQVNLGLYLFPRDPNRNILSGNGYCWHVDLNQYPHKHIARGYTLKQWENNRRR